MGERNGYVAQGGQTLLHPRSLCGVSYADRVFNLSGSEILFLLVAGLVVLGPERLPGVIRRVARVYADLRTMARNFEQEFKDTFDEPLRELRSTAEELRSGFGEVDDEPSPPMRPEQAVLPPTEQHPHGSGGSDE